MAKIQKAKLSGGVVSLSPILLPKLRWCDKGVGGLWKEGEEGEEEVHAKKSV
jgi:hypothetical protein